MMSCLSEAGIQTDMYLYSSLRSLRSLRLGFLMVLPLRGRYSDSQVDTTSLHSLCSFSLSADCDFFAPSFTILIKIFLSKQE